MIDSRYKNLLIRLNRAHGKYLKLLNEAEEEYKNRFGNYPSEVDDDFWIDSFYQSDSGARLEDVLKHGALANEH